MNSKTDQPALIMHVTTVSVSVRAFLVGHIHYAQSRGSRVEVVCGQDDRVEDLSAEIGVPVHTLPLKRAISPLRDLGVVFKLVCIFRKHMPDVVHAHTPKGGLIGMIAAFLAGVPCRVYTVHGLVYLSKTGWKRRLLMVTESISCKLANLVLCVSRSIRDTLVHERLCAGYKADIVANGSICGVDTERFNRGPEVLANAERHRIELGIPEGSLVLGFVGRLTRDKGIVELCSAWKALREKFPELHLLIVGTYESEDPVPEDVRSILDADERVHQAGWQTQVAPFLALMDVLALPTYREGFGLVLIEAAAMGVATVATRVPGVVDAVEDGVSSVLVPARDAGALERACDGLLTDSGRRLAMAQAGQRFAIEQFSPDPIWRGTYNAYLKLRKASQGR